MAEKKEGVLVKQGGFRKSWKQRLFVLQSSDDSLIYFSKKKIDAGVRQVKGKISLVDATISPVDEKKFGKKYCFQITAKKSGRSYPLVAPNERDYIDWLRVLTNVSQRASQVSANKWEEGKVCEGCSKEFTIVRRRHHCRSCGHSFCGECSNNEAKLNDNGETGRVCDACSVALGGAAKGRASVASRSATAPAPSSTRGNGTATATADTSRADNGRTISSGSASGAAIDSSDAVSSKRKARADRKDGPASSSLPKSRSGKHDASSSSSDALRESLLSDDERRRAAATGKPATSRTGTTSTAAATAGTSSTPANGGNDIGTGGNVQVSVKFAPRAHVGHEDDDKKCCCIIC